MSKTTGSPPAAGEPKPSARTRRWRRRIMWALAIVLILTVAARVFISLLLPTVMNKVAGGYGMTCGYDQMELNLLNGDAGIWGLRVQPKGGGESILAADYCHGNISVLNLLRGRLDVWRAEADGVEINVDRTADGRIPLLDRFVGGPSIAPAPAPAAPASTTKPIDLSSPLKVDALRLQHIRVHIKDQSVTPTFDTVLAMSLRLSDLGSPDRPARFEFDLSDNALLDSLEVTGEGRSGGKTLDASMHMVARGVRLKPAAVYLQTLGIHPVADGLTFNTDGQIHTAPAANNADGFSGSIVLDHISATADLKEALALDRFELDADMIDTKSIHLGRLLMDGVRANGERADNGKLRLAGLEWDPSLIARPATQPIVAAASTQVSQPSLLADLLAEPWSLNELSVKNLNATFHDSAVAPAADLSLVSDELSIKNINHDPNNLNAGITFTGKLRSPRLIDEIRLTASAQPFAAKKTFRLDVDASGLKPDALGPYLDELGLESQFKSGRFTCAVGGWLGIADNGDLQGDVNVDHVWLRDGSDLFTFNGIHATGLGLDPATGKILVKDIELSGPGISAHRGASGALECLGLKTKPAVAPMHSTDVAAAESPSTAPAVPIVLPRIEIGRFAWKDIQIALTDEAVSPVTRIEISNAGVVITDLRTDSEVATQPARQGHVHAWISAAGIAKSLSVEGDVSPGTEPGRAGLAFDVNVDGKAITAAGIAPYLKSMGIEPVLADGSLRMHAKAGVSQSGDGLIGSLAADHVRFADGSSELAAVDRFAVDGISVHPGEISVASIDVEHPRSAVARDIDNSFLAGGVRLRLPVASTEGSQPTTAPSVNAGPLLGLPLAVILEKLRVRDASLALTDRAVQPAVRTTAWAAVDLDHLTLGRPAGPAVLNVRAKATGVADELSVKGTLTTAPDHQAAHLQIAGNGLRAGPLAAYVPPGVSVGLKDGRFTTALDADLSVNPKGGYQATLVVNGLDYRDGAGGQSLFSLDSVKVVAPRVDLPYTALAIDEISVAGIETSAQLTPNGTVNLLGLVLGGPVKDVSTRAAPAVQAKPAANAPSRTMSAADLVAAAHRTLALVTVEKLDLGVRRLSLEDDSRPAAAPLVISDLHLKNVERIEWLGRDADSKPPTKLELTCRINPLVDRVTLDALVSPFARQPSVQLDVLASGVHGDGLTALAPELKGQVDGSQLTDGRFSAHLFSLMKMDRRSPVDFDLSHGLGLDFVLKDVEYRASGDGPVLLGVEEIQSDGIRIEPANSFVHVKTLEITKPIGLFPVDKAGLHALGWVVKLPAALSPTTQPAVQPSAVTLADIVPDDGAAQNKAAGAATKAKAELRIDKLLISGLDGRFEDHACDPALIVPLNGLDVEVRDISSLAMSEDRPIRFSAIVNSGKVRLPRRTDSAGNDGQQQWEDRDLFAQVTANGKVSLYPTSDGWVKTSVSGFELSSLKGLAKQFGITLTQGTYDSELDARFNPDGSVDTSARLRVTDLSLSEPAHGPIERILGLNAPLDVAIAAVEGPDGGISIPVNLTLRRGQVSMEDIFLALPPAIGSVIATAIVSAPIKVVGGGLSVFGIEGAKKGAEQPVVIAFVPGAVGLGETELKSLNVLLKRLNGNADLTLTIRHVLGGGDVRLAMQRANPSPADCLDMQHQLLSHKAELLRLRADATGQARAQLMALGENNAEAALARLAAINRELAGTENALDQVLELLRPGADRQAGRRMRAVALDFGRERLDAVRDVLLVSRVKHIADRIRIVDAQYNPADGEKGGEIFIAVVEKKE
jgi:hypothetical protein